MNNILLLDNYDSFTYNLADYVQALTGQEIDVYRNDKIALEEIAQYDTIILSPGPGLPKDAGILIPLIKQYYSSKKILGVCLGHQAIAEVFGGQLVNLPKVYHGTASEIHIINSDEALYKNLPSRFKVGRYHSWVVNRDSLPNYLIPTSIDDKGIVMSFKHRLYNIRGVQFHPESVLTEYGWQIMGNWLGIKDDIMQGMSDFEEE